MCDFQEICEELSYRVGEINLNNDTHLLALVHILRENKWTETAIDGFLTNLTESLTGKSAVGASGGFAASSNIRDFEKKARDVYGKDIAGVIGSTKRQAQTSFDKIQEIVNQWRQTAQAI